jgi:hypothetical protein
MKSITIHGVDNRLDEMIRKKANKLGLSLNKTIKMILEEALGLSRHRRTDHREEFLDLFGLWTEKDEQEFNEAVRDFERIDNEDWQ